MDEITSVTSELNDVLMRTFGVTGGVPRRGPGYFSGISVGDPTVCDYQACIVSGARAGTMPA
ncbi:MAG: hypothetical protein HWE39_19900 [Oceanospirillaceae bacterium]|nr:hypothetical protein [Oceanospirillaceae bacterium]